ncbi:type VI secretion system protein TssA [Rubrivivax benzoatilyticus]|uniref:Type VI secretion system protein TssA n=1 Tax=Rubrivivax benzoatilyticus TaxID=316997 RepID=A0ABX0I1K0_9BURK|nr:type VI secretion system protein TssA [Rubrivivax benzoatilyticus]EGJ09141.1 ImpA [Rubrivivax benzoatilyticus JA2 = ATCC BAA-35]NHK99688.1 type VI secretion system protein TssA [Rubrivivax benzoatilyticus]NHL25561.1 type VI secretion system protein TssA [Rubrivivax benzoatilyticus]
MTPADLLAPLPGETGTGSDLALGPEFEAIARWREEDDATLAQGAWRTPPRQADWDAVQRECAALLATRSKDLRLAGWWGEASARLQGPAGLADGLELAAALCERFGAELHPRIVDGDTEPRAAALGWWLSRVVRLAGTAPVLRLGRRGLGIGELELLRRRAALSADNPDGADGAVQKELNQALATGVDQAAHGPAAALRRAREALSRLQAVCDTQLQADCPSFDAATDALEQAAATWARFARDGGLAVPDVVRPAHPPGGGSTGGQTLPESPSSAAAPRPAVPDDDPAGAWHRPESGEPQGRDQAIAQLRQIAEYLHRTEPHNPAAYLADKAARWAGLALHAWLREVLADEQALARLETTLGVSRGADPGHEAR